MENLTKEEVEIYNNLPFKIRQYLSINDSQLLWVKSEYGMGYKLQYPKPVVYKYNNNGLVPNKYWKTAGNGPNQYYTNGTSTSTLSGNYMSSSQYDFPILTTENPSFKWAIPYFADTIMEAAEDIAVTFLRAVNSDPDDLNAYAVDPEEEKKLFNFEMTSESQKFGSLTLDGKTFEIHIHTGISFRHMALEVLRTVSDYMIDNYRPSITDLKDVVNIIKGEDNKKAVVFKNPYQVKRLLTHYPYCLFAESEDSDIIEFIEGKFRVYSEVKDSLAMTVKELNELRTTLNNMKISTQTTSNTLQDMFTVYGGEASNDLTTNTSKYLWRTGASNDLTINTSKYFGTINPYPCSEIPLTTSSEIMLNKSTSIDVFKEAYKNQLISKSTLHRALGINTDGDTI